MAFDPVMTIGLIAASLTTGGIMPQVIKAHTTRQTKDISLAMWVMSALGVALWVVYGVLLNVLPVIIANSVTLCLMLYIVYLKVKYG
ncbi:MAG: SemiSWEET transporter [Candidatus Margulisbacteria bacterium]|jgi:MtN3 and saliva related transmembrane protein|nr:SemiSWEET transporter [Candidatus Margulisiibacteriota bacterium]